MLTAIVSDLHLGMTAGTDIALRPAVRERLAQALEGADRIVLLGDLLELRERPMAGVLEMAAPALDAIGQAAAGKQVLIVPGNHDHELIAPALDAARIDDPGPLVPAGSFSPDSGALSRRVAAHMSRADVVLAYPGVWLREDVYATHGHYLDLHLTVPRMECVLASAIARFAGDPSEARSPGPDDYEAALSPLYAFAHSIVQRSEARAVTRGANVSRAVWGHANPNGSRRLTGFAVGKVGIPAAVVALNALGLGPFRSDISGTELRRAGLQAMGEVIERLGVRARHVIFGHTHRAGPFPGDEGGWELSSGTALHNTGTWLLERVFLSGGAPAGAGNPYWPGSVTLLRDEGPPELTNALSDLDLSGLDR